MQKNWLQFLNPNVMRQHFVCAGLFLVAYEILIKIIKEKPCFFFSNRWTAENGWETGDEYNRCVLALDPKGRQDPLRGSLAWFQQMDAIDEIDLNTFHFIKKNRNKYAHELEKILISEDSVHFERLFSEILWLVTKIDSWWIVNVEIATDPEMIDKEFSENQLKPGSILLLQIMMRVALGNDEEAWELYNAMKSELERRESKL